MQAWQLIEAGAPSTLSEVPEPVLEPDGVIVEVKAAGLCHSDVGYLDGTLTYALAFTPIALGHEIAGVVSAVGGEVSRFRVGDRVVIPAKVEGPGTSLNGGFAPRVAAPAEFVVPLPDGVAWDQAAAATDAGLTSYHAAIGQGGVRAGTKVGIIGFGGLGSVGAQIAMAVGAHVVVAEKSDKARELARSLGVTEIGTDIAQFADRELDVIIDYAGFGTTTAGAIEAVRPGGKVVQVGMGVTEGVIPLVLLAVKQVELVGSLAGSNQDCADVLALIEAGTVASRLTHLRFDEIGDGIGRLERGEVTGRLVALFE